MKYAVQGCCHGQLGEIYAKILDHNSSLIKGQNVDHGIDDDEPISLLLICGDFQAIRNQRDLDQLACPPKYRQMGDFHLYWKGEAVAPVLTLFIGGNHEASAHMYSLYYGGWVAKNIYYLGHSSVIRVGLEDGSSLKIGSISGIHSSKDEKAPYWEQQVLLTRSPEDPVFERAVRSSYHTRLVEVEKLSLYNDVKAFRDSCNVNENTTTIFLSHEWPLGIIEGGNKKRLLSIKKHFLKDLRPGASGIGSPNLLRLLKELKPNIWYSAHMHVRYEAEYRHDNGVVSDFLALDKCHPRRCTAEHLEICKISCVKQLKPLTLLHDPLWLSIQRMYALGGFDATDNDDNDDNVDSVVDATKTTKTTKKTKRITTQWVDINVQCLEITRPTVIASPEVQTEAFCQMLQIPNTITPIIKNPSRIDF